MNNPVGWFEIYVDNVARAKAFYEAVFELTLTPMEMPGCEMQTFPMAEDGKGISGAIIKMDDNAPGAGGTVVYFSCADCAVEAERVGAAGGKVVVEKMPIGPNGFIAMAIDTEGNSIGLHSMA
ncbi:MAG: VOC family protein [Planctomycetes bacterium]|nr:VOC family protein [Planctomycetota bacterium]